MTPENTSRDVRRRFVVQRHQGRTLHYDFRLERDGVFRSWAVPKGVPEELGIRRLAVQVPDHALAFGDFEGIIPAGEYGAGKIEIWDRGSYELHAWSDASITLVHPVFACADASQGVVVV
jgi:DNA ligase D-like protein (predicted 3'-phosphoesterase)